MNALIGIIECRMDALYASAITLTDVYWSAKIDAQQSRPFSEWGKYGVRARRRGFMIQIEWSYVRFFGPKGGQKPVSTYVRRGRNNVRYSISMFQRAPAWEIEVIDELEDKFAMIRIEAEMLKKVHRLCHQYMKFIEHGDIVQEVRRRMNIIESNN